MNLICNLNQQKRPNQCTYLYFQIVSTHYPFKHPEAIIISLTQISLHFNIPINHLDTKYKLVLLTNLLINVIGQLSFLVFFHLTFYLLI